MNSTPLVALVFNRRHTATTTKEAAVELWNLRNEVPFFAERICGFVDFISVVLMEIVLLHLKY